MISCNVCGTQNQSHFTHCIQCQLPLEKPEPLERQEIVDGIQGEIEEEVKPVFHVREAVVNGTTITYEVAEDIDYIPELMFDDTADNMSDISNENSQSYNNNYGGNYNNNYNDNYNNNYSNNYNNNNISNYNNNQRAYDQPEARYNSSRPIKDESVIPVYKWLFIMWFCGLFIGAIYLWLNHDDPNVQNYAKATLIIVALIFILSLATIVGTLSFLGFY